MIKRKTLPIIANLTDGILVFDKQRNLSLINPRAQEFLRVNEKEIIGKPVLELAGFGNLKRLIKILGKKIKSAPMQELTVAENLVLEVSAVPLFEQKKKIGTLVILRDITREKRIEQMKTEFVSITAHQLPTPLSAIKWTLRMLLDGDLGEVTKEQKKFIEKTYRSNERMIGLINDLLNITQIEEGRHVYKKDFYDIEKICRDIISSYKEEIKRKKINFKFIAAKKLPEVNIDKEKIELAIRNIIENAIRYTSSKGKMIVFLQCKEKGKNKKEIKVSVYDSGVGIPTDQQFRVFTKFFRGANIIRMETEGTGLGLFIAKNIIEAHKGRIWFESQEGKGSTFCFTLPC